jgi:hypothetical protein
MPASRCPHPYYFEELQVADLYTETSDGATETSRQDLHYFCDIGP